MKDAIRRALVFVLRKVLAVPGQGFRRKAGSIVADALSLKPPDSLEAEVKTVSTIHGEARFYCIGEVAGWRVDTLLTKEPETIEWIDGFGKGDVFWDIGANVGIYSIYAAISGKVRVLAFEPSAANYFLLNKNIEINDLDKTASAYCVAFNDRNAFSALHMQNTDPGGALSSFDEPIDQWGKAFRTRFEQGAVGFSVDGLIAAYGPPFPNHIKIDVDGIEGKIVSGMEKTLADPRLKSLSVELDSGRPEYVDDVVSMIRSGGFELSARRHSEMFDNGPFKSFYNYQFRRQAGD